MRFVHDETLSDLAGITASCNITKSQADRDNPCMVTVTIEASTLHNLLTMASLHMYDNPFRPDVVDENDSMAEVVRQNNQEGQDYYDLMRDTISILTSRISVATSPDYGQSNEQSVKSDRKHRRLIEEMQAKGGEAAKKRLAELEANSPQGLRAWFDTQDVKPLRASELVGLLVMMRDEPRAIEPKITLAILASYMEEAKAAEKAKDQVKAARAALGGF
jgi:hypothetical protein